MQNIEDQLSSQVETLKADLKSKTDEHEEAIRQLKNKDREIETLESKLILVVSHGFVSIFCKIVGDLETAESKYEEAKLELEKTLAELTEI